MINYVGSTMETAYEDMQSISLAFGLLALLFLATAAACFFINKVYHSVNISLYFLGQREKKKKRPDREGGWQDKSKKRPGWRKSRKVFYVFGLLVLAAVSWQGRQARGAQRFPGPVLAGPMTSAGWEAGNTELAGDESMKEETLAETQEEENGEVENPGGVATTETARGGEEMNKEAAEEESGQVESKDQAEASPEAWDIPLLYLQTRPELIKSEDGNRLVLADSRGGVMRIILAETNYLSDSMEEKGNLYVNVDEGGRRSVLTYNWKNMVSAGEGLWAMDIPLKGEENKELGYQIIFEYQNSKGQSLRAGDRKLEAFGSLEKGRFESCWFVVDAVPPQMEEEFSLASPGHTQPDDGSIIALSDSVTGRIEIRDRGLDRSKIVVKAHPLDIVARKSAGSSEQLLPDGNVDIPVFTLDRQGDSTVVEAGFQEEGRWQLYLSCADLAGNPGRTGTGDVWAVSKEFIIDHTAPSLKISYSPEVLIRRNRVCPEDVDAQAGGQLARVNVKDCQLMFSGRQEIWLWIHEDYFKGEDVRISLIKETWDRQQEKEKDQNTAVKEGSWLQELVSKPEEYMAMTDWEKVEEGSWLARICLKKEGNYRLRISYEDLGGRELSPDNSGTENCALFMGEEGYLGPLITVDRSDPAILSVRCESDQGPANSGVSGDNCLFTDRPAIILRVADENFCAGRLLVRDQISYADGREEEDPGIGSASGKDSGIKWKRLQKEEGYVYESSIPITKEGMHKLSFVYTDAAGHSSEKKELRLTYDCQGPVVDYARVTIQEGKMVDIRQEEAESLFLDQGGRIKVRVRDSVSGVESIFYRFSGRYCDDQGREYSGTSEYKKLALESSQEGPTADWTFWLEPETENFIGRLDLYTMDAAGNSSPLIRSREIAGETDWLHESRSHIDWELSEAAHVSEDDRIMYFRKSAKVKVRFRDDWSGIKAWTILASDKDLTLKEILAGCTDLGTDKGEEKRARSLERELSLNGEEYGDSSADRPLTLYAAFIDYAGHYKLDIYDDYRLVMDQKKPSVQVEYDLRGDGPYGSYFNKSRTATVTVSDLNFNPESVKWYIGGPAGGWKTGSWTRKGDLNTCMVSFNRDGGGYSLALEGSDYSGNSFSWDKDQSFVIDQTAPVITVIMQGRKGAGYQKYYPKSQRFLVRIKEENLRDTDLIITNKTENRDPAAGEVSLLREPLQKGQGYYYAWLTVSDDGSYSPEISCRDMAGNKAAVVSMEEFIIDKTAPILDFKGIREGETFSGPVACKISCQDQNLDMESVEIQVVSLSGKPVEDGRLAPEMVLSYRGDQVCGLEESLNDSRGGQLEDGIYRINVRGEDLAGNPIRGRTSLNFRVNRKGAAYLLDRDLKARLEDGYLLGTGQLRILEYSVNPTLTQIKLIRENQDQYELETDDYQLKNELVGEGAGPWSGWYKKTICLPGQLFNRDGTYRILIKTRALDENSRGRIVINQTDNEIKGQELAFKVDRTPPQVHLGGLDREIYEEKEHSFRLTVMDNIAFDRLELSIERGIFKKKKDLLLIRPGDLDDMNSILLTLKAYGGYQRIHYKAWDRAGNVIDSDSCGDSRNCLVAGISDKPDQSAGLAGSSKSQGRQTGEVPGNFSEKEKGKRMTFFPALFAGLFALLFMTGTGKLIKDWRKMNGIGLDMGPGRSDQEDYETGWTFGDKDTEAGESGDRSKRDRVTEIRGREDKSKRDRVTVAGESGGIRKRDKDTEGRNPEGRETEIMN